MREVWVVEADGYRSGVPGLESALAWMRIFRDAGARLVTGQLVETDLEWWEL